MRKGIGWAALLAACTGLCLTGCAPAAPLSGSGLYLDTAITITLYDTRDPSVLEACFQQIADLESLLSRTVEGSDVWNINHAGGEAVEVAEETAELIRTALDYADKTGGALDISVAPASRLWDFKAESPSLPDEEELAQAASHIDWTKIELQGCTVRLADPKMELDLGAVAKGYIADRVAQSLREQGVESALLDFGGNIVALGGKEGRDWTIGIRSPQDGEALAAAVAVRDCSVVTSGTYERGFDLGGVRYHHILDPQTGWPVDNGLASVTILSARSVDGDALSTACFVLGEEKGMALVEELDGVEALFIREDGTSIRSSGFPEKE